jgi:hypothetical protein
VEAYDAAGNISGGRQRRRCVGDRVRIDRGATCEPDNPGRHVALFAVGNDWDNAVPRTLPGNWTMLDQWVNTGVGDTYWSQYTSIPTGAAGSVVTVNDTAPTSDRWNLVAVELLNDD